MVPKIGDRIRINPRWLAEGPTHVGAVSPFGEMLQAGFDKCDLLVKGAFHFSNWHILRVTDGKLSINVAVDHDGSYTGCPAVRGIPYFVPADSRWATGGEAGSRCPLCGSSGWTGLVDFHCDNGSCPNGRTA